MSILRPCRYLLWATPRTDATGRPIPYEVSRHFEEALFPRCPSASRCPDEAQENPEPFAHPVPPDCPYAFADKAACIGEYNRAALLRGTFDPGEARRVANYLEIMGYQVEREELPAVELDARPGGRILLAHGRIYNYHEIIYESGPAGLALTLIRNPYRDEREADRGDPEGSAWDLRKGAPGQDGGGDPADAD